jgi:hypothetical protein
VPPKHEVGRSSRPSRTIFPCKTKLFDQHHNSERFGFTLVLLLEEGENNHFCQSMLVLAVPHQLQGQKFQSYVQDNSYSILVKNFVNQVDFGFEEAAGRGPSIAEELVNKMSGPGRYLDFDPPSDERLKFGIAANLTDFFPRSTPTILRMRAFPQTSVSKRSVRRFGFGEYEKRNLKKVSRSLDSLTTSVSHSDFALLE